MVVSEERGRVILSSWLHGEHLEDVKAISPDAFPEPYRSVARDIRSGHDVSGLISKHGVRTVTEILGDYRPAIYQVVMTDLLRDEMLATIPVSATPDELARHADKYRRYWQDVPKPVDIPETYWDEIGERRNREAVGTGIAVVDRLTDGIRPGSLTIVGARPSVGKSAFTLQVAMNVARKLRKVLFIPLEMTAAETIDRIVLRYGTDLDYADLRSGKLTDEKRNAVNTVIEYLYDLRDYFKIYEGVRDLEKIHALIKDEKPDLVVIDQLSQITTKDDRATIRERYVEVTRQLKAIALQEKTAIWLPVQMNRESSKTGTVSIDYLKESGSIEEDADIVLLLSNVKDEEGNFQRTAYGRLVQIRVAKNRQGECGSEQLDFIGQRFTFRSVYQGEE